MHIVKFLFVSALPVLALSFSLGCKPSGAAPGDTPITTNASTTTQDVDPLATWVADHFGSERYVVPYSSADPKRGAQDNALVTIVVFVDYDRPQPALVGHLDKLLAAHGDELLVILKPISRRDGPKDVYQTLAVLAAAEQDRGWEMHALLLEPTNPNAKTDYRSLAAHVGVPDLDRFDAALERGTSAALQVNMDLAQQLGVNTDLFWFVNGAPYTDMVNFEDLRGIHAAEHELALGLVEAGAQPQEVYSTIVRDAPTKREPAITYRRPFDGPPLSGRKTLANDIVIEDFVLGEGEPVYENALITYNFRVYSTIDPKQIMGSWEKPSKLPINDLGRNNDPISRAMIDAVQDMKPGGKRRVQIPAKLVERDAPPGSPSNGDLVATIELVSVGPAPVLAGLDAFAGKPLRSKKFPNKLATHDYVIGEGEGEGAKQGDLVAVHYIAHLANGFEFDSSHGRGDELPVTLGAKQVIPGFDLGLEGVRAGMLRKIVIPAKLGYGDVQLGPIPAGSTLTFYVQVMSVSSPAEPESKSDGE